MLQHLAGAPTPLLGRLLGLGRRVLLLGHLAHGLLGLARAREPIDLRLELRQRVDELGVALDGHVEQPVHLVVLVAEQLALLGVARARVLELEELLAQLALRLGQKAQQALVLPRLGTLRAGRIRRRARIAQLGGGALAPRAVVARVPG